VRRSRYFFLAAFFLAAGFLAAFFFAAILVYLLHSISDPMNGFGDGSQMHSSKSSAAHQLVASVMATMSSITFKLL
jgi:predicted PurR-regulated permease PerM